MVDSVVALLWIAAGLVALALVTLTIVIQHGRMLSILTHEINSRMSKLLEVTAELAHFEGRDQERAAEALRQSEVNKAEQR